jgi:glutaconate CoA-transferase subunit B
MADHTQAGCAWPEFAAVVLSRELRDGEVGSPGGARSEIPLAAARLAQLSHAPNLALITSAVGFAINATGKRWGPLCHSTTDYRNIHAGAEAVLHFLSIFRTRRDWFFAGGLQVDTYGNLNLTAIGDIRAPKLHGPGAAGLAFAGSCATRYFIYIQEHSKRSIVDKVDYVTSMGYGAGPGDRERLGLRGGGPALVITPMALFDFCEGTRRMRLKSFHAPYTVEDVVANTGAAIIVPDDVRPTPPPTERELHLLRTQVDRDGVLGVTKSSTDVKYATAIGH